MSILNILDQATVIPVLEVANLEAAAPLAEALSAGGLRVAELTLRTECAIEAMVTMKRAAPTLSIGMGTIMSADDAKRSCDAGAEFLVSPGSPPRLLEAVADLGAPMLPGVASASEAMIAAEAGFHAQKFFPAEPAGGINYIQALAGPLPKVMFCPTGAITAQKAPDYLALSNVACVGGSWIANKQMIAAGDWATIEKNAQKAARMKKA